MEASSQKGRRAPRPWTPQDQVTAEVAAACGVSLSEIGKALNRSHGVIRCKLIPEASAALSLCQKQWYKRNRVYVLQKQSAYRSLNRDQILERQRKYQLANADKVSEKNRRWYLAHRESAALSRRIYYYANRARLQILRRRWREQNPEKCCLYVMRWRNKNKDKAREFVRRRHARRRASLQTFFKPLTIEQKLYRFNIWLNACAYCNTGGPVTVDHVLALASGGVDEPANIVPACRRCNSSKQHKPVESWYRSQPFFTEARWRKIQRHCPAAVTGQLPLALGPTP